MIHFAAPGYLWLLLLVPLVLLLSRRLRLISFGRRAGIVGVRILLLLALILGLAELEWRRSSRDLSIFFLVDHSDSIPAEQRQEQLDRIEALSQKAGTRDETGVIVFGAQPSMETSPVRAFDFEGRFFSEVEGVRTDIASAARLALAAFPADRMRRMVLLSDGNENMGSAVEVARIARNSGVPVDVIPVNYDTRNDVKVDKIVVPQRTTRDAPFDLKVFLSADQETDGTLRIFEDGRLIIEERTTVRPGRNAPLVMSRRLQDGGFHNYRATFEAANDLRPQNNEANAFTYLKAEPRVLVVEGGEFEAARYLVGALRVENIAVDVVGPSEIPVGFDRLQRYDSIILSNVAADRMSTAQMQMIERAVHDLGLGLIMIGGENAFGAGGYIDTPIELALPVSMDIKQKKMLPNGALVIVLHTCEMPNGNTWAREISLASLNVLASQDYFGINYLGASGGNIGGGWGETWLWDPPLQQVGNKKNMRTMIKGVQPLDAQAFDGLLRMAADELIAVTAETKHIVVISDGDPQPPSQNTVQRIRDAGITVSGVAIFPHDPSTVNSLREMAYWGAGEFYYPKTGEELPRIFTKEATIVRKSLIREEDFTPRVSTPSELISGFGGFPQLRGYVITSAKDLATEALTTEWDDPLLVHWRYGLGKTVAFTSDAKDKWATPWVSWGSFSKFWAQTVRWSLRETNSPNFQVNTELQGGIGRVTIDAVDEAGNFENFIDFDATVIGPDFTPENLSIRQIAPGRYEGTFPASKVGTYMLSMSTNQESPDGNPQFLTSGVSLSYSPEYETSRSSEEFLRRIAEASGGQYVTDVATYNPYLRNLVPMRRPTPMWPWLLLLGAMLLPVDIFLRRVYLSWSDIGQWIATKVFGILPRRREAAEEYGQRMDSLRAAKERALRDKEEEQKEKEAREAFRDRFTGTSNDGKSIFDREADAPPAPRRERKITQPTDTGSAGPKQPTSGMDSLLEAKKRAQQRRKK